MLPYIDLPTLGPITAFGVLAMLGVFFGTSVGTRHAERLGLDLPRVRKLAAYCGVGGILGAHWVDYFFYQDVHTVAGFFNPFAGISSYGGLIGGTFGFLVWSRRHGRNTRLLRYADAAALGVVVLMTFGRAGCATAHDHVGVATSFPLAVDFPRIGPHHDLGLYEFALWALLILPASVLFLRRPRRAGMYLGIVSIAYAVPRFFLDNLRREFDNPRYAALTPAQWGCIATVAIGIALLVHVRRESPPDPYLTPTPWRTYLRGFFRFS